MDTEAQGTDESEDQRNVEITTLTAIFPELRVDEKNPYAFSLEVPVNPSKAATVSFLAATSATAPNPDRLRTDEAPRNQIDSHNVSYLPSVNVHVSLPQGYPDREAPLATISTSPPWFLAVVLRRLQDDCTRLWDDLGRDLVVFTYVDHLQQAADDAFGLADANGSLEVDPEHKIAILDYDIKAKQAAFDRETFDCGVCLGLWQRNLCSFFFPLLRNANKLLLDPKKGAACHRMLNCGHVFCRQCLQEYYNNAIQEGDIASVRCLAPNCAREQEESKGPSKKRRKPKTINPSELLQIPLEPATVQRYVARKYKNVLESDKNTIYCPRPWCSGAARSRKHKKPGDLGDGDEEPSDAEVDSDSEAEDGGGEDERAFTTKKKDLLSVCEDCGFAFCSRCCQSWHGEFFNCTPRRDKEELSAEEKASIEYLALHTTPCPTCAAPAQKTHGCNHMICYRCQSHFCYLCSAWLSPGNPYEHFNKSADGRITGCYMRLWELEEGDGNDVGLLQ